VTPETILADLLASGIEPSVTPDKTGIVVPAGALSPAQRAAVLNQKAELIAYLVESSRITAQLMEAAMRRCNQFNDSEMARQAMREQVLEVPPRLRKDLLDYFSSQAAMPPGSALKKQSENNHD
jgi:hypothetical protein